MPSERTRQRARLNTTISDASCPGLIAFLDGVPAGDKDALIRAILLEWFERHAAQDNLDVAVAAMAGKSKLVAALRKAGLPNEYLPNYAPVMSATAEKAVAPVIASAPVPALSVVPVPASMQASSPPQQMVQAATEPVVVGPEGHSLPVQVATQPVTEPAAEGDAFDPTEF